MSEQNKKHILVTGSHRSGSTWVERIINNAHGVFYVQEPFNITHKEKNSTFPFKYWYEYISDDFPRKTQETVHAYLRSYIDFSIRARITELKYIYSRKTLYKIVGRQFIRRNNKRILFKDPIAFMSAPWLAKQLPAQVVVLIRHPAAFVASLKKKSWTFDFSNFTNQKRIMEDVLFPFKDQIEEYALSNPDIISQGILLWNIIHSIILDYKTKYEEEWYFVRHEDLSLNPINEFKNLFKYLNLEMDDKTIEAIRVSTTSKRSSLLHRDSKKNIHSWKKRLTPEEIERIKTGTQALFPSFYSKSYWE